METAVAGRQGVKGPLGGGLGTAGGPQGRGSDSGRERSRCEGRAARGPVREDPGGLWDPGDRTRSQESVTGGCRPQAASTSCSALSTNPGPGPSPGLDPDPAVSASRCQATVGGGAFSVIYRERCWPHPRALIGSAAVQ